jgi:anti-sigma factor RsiW
MDKSEIRAILSAYHPGDDIDDPRFQQAKAAAEADPELAQWWAEQQELDRVISSKLMSTEVPRHLKTQLTAWEKRTVRRNSWNRGIILAAAVIVALAVIFSSWRGLFQPAASLADFRDEMVSFVKVTPSLELETSDLTRATNFLGKSGAPSQFEVPRRLRNLELVGCRTLRYRGYDVALLCFKREGGRIAHLLVVDRAAVGRLPNKKNAELAKQGEWMTAGWEEGGRAYLLAAEGEEQAARQFLSDE